MKKVLTPQPSFIYYKQVDRVNYILMEFFMYLFKVLFLTNFFNECYDDDK